MATYVIGDLQGCFEELQLLLDKVAYQPGKDDVWLVGDLVNRGPDSLRCLRWAMDNASAVVLGNHDLHLLAVAAGIKRSYDADTIDDILDAPDRGKLLSWLRQQPLMHMDKSLDLLMLHAGLPPQWTIPQAISCATEVQQDLGDDGSYLHLLESMYKKRPTKWNDDMGDMDRKCYTVNALTRMRYCTPDGHIDVAEKCPPGDQPTRLIPWFMMPQRNSRQQHIVFGHWSTLIESRDIEFSRWNITPLDYGCVWGNQMAALCVQDGKLHRVKSRTTPPDGYINGKN